MRYTGVRSDTFAVFRGREFEASPIFPEDQTVMIGSHATDNPDTTLFQWNDGWNAWTARVPATACERLYRATTVARYQGHRVSIESVDESGMARIQYADWNGAWAEENGFETIDKYEYAKTVHAGELYEVHEKQRDLLFRDWREATFARPAEPKRAKR
jgi:hypothetical protein